MATTHKYGFNFLIPLFLTDAPIPFDQFKKEEGGFYTYNEYFKLDGKKAFYTPSNTHAILSVNVTSVLQLAIQFPQYLAAVAPGVEIIEGVQVDRWEDADQSNHLFILSTEPEIAYGYDAFAAVSSLFQGEENVG